MSHGIQSQAVTLSKRDEAEDAASGNRHSLDSKNDKAINLKGMIASGGNFSVARADSKKFLRTLSLQNSSHPTSPHKEDAPSPKQRFSKRRTTQNSMDRVSSKAASPRKKGEIKVFEGLLEGIQQQSEPVVSVD